MDIGAGRGIDWCEDGVDDDGASPIGQDFGATGALPAGKGMVRCEHGEE